MKPNADRFRTCLRAAFRTAAARRVLVCGLLGSLWALEVGQAAGPTAPPAAANPGPGSVEGKTTLSADAPLVFDTNLGLIERSTMQAVLEALEGLRLDPGSDILLHAMTTNEGGWFVEDCIARVLSQKGYQIHLVSAEELRARAAASQGRAPAGDGGGGAPSLGDAVNRTQATGPADSVAGSGAAGDSADPSRLGRNHQDMLNRARAAGAGATPAKSETETLNPLPEGEGLVLSYRIIEFGVTYHDSWRRGFMGPRLVERLASVNLYTRLVNGSEEEVLWVGRGRAERLDVVPKSKLDLLEGRNYPFQKPVLRGGKLSKLAEPMLVSGIIAGLVFLFYSSQN